MDKMKNATIFAQNSLTISFEGFMNNIDEALLLACKNLHVEYIGDRVEESRTKVRLVKYKNRLYFLQDAVACQKEFHFFSCRILNA